MSVAQNLINFLRPVFSAGEVASEVWRVETSGVVPNTITITVAPTIIDTGGSIAVTGTVSGGSATPQYAFRPPSFTATPMSGVPVTIQLFAGADAAVQAKTALTNAAGSYATSFTIPENGSYTVVARLGSDNAALSSEAVAVTVRSPTPVPSALTLTVSPTSVKTGSPVSFTGTLADQNGNGVGNAPVYIDIKNADGTLRVTLNATTLQEADASSGGVIGEYIQTYSFTEAGTYTVQARAPTSFAFGVAFPNSSSNTIQVYDEADIPMLPEWFLPAAVIGSAAFLVMLINLLLRRPR